MMAAAGALPSPYPPTTPLLPTADTAIVLGPVGAMLESNYFHAPPPPGHGRVRLFPCQPRLRAAAQTHRIEQVCD